MYASASIITEIKKPHCTETSQCGSQEWNRTPNATNLSIVSIFCRECEMHLQVLCRDFCLTRNGIVTLRSISPHTTGVVEHHACAGVYVRQVSWTSVYTFAYTLQGVHMRSCMCSLVVRRWGNEDGGVQQVNESTCCLAWGVIFDRRKDRGVVCVFSIFNAGGSVCGCMCVYTHTHKHTEQMGYLDVSPWVGMRHLKGPKNPDGLNLGIHIFVYVYKVHVCMCMLGGGRKIAVTPFRKENMSKKKAVTVQSTCVYVYARRREAVTLTAFFFDIFSFRKSKAKHVTANHR